MCGIVGGIAERSITNILIEGLKRLEYRGYDSAGLALINNHQVLRERRVGKVSNLEQAVNAGAFGAPFYIVRETDQRFWGQDRLEFLDRHLASL